MNITVSVDSRGMEAALDNLKTKAADLLEFEAVGASVVITAQKIKVPVDTAATRTSIRSHYETVTDVLIEDDIGPETDYAPYIEYGVASKPNYPIQPFVVPSGTGNNKTSAVRAVQNAVSDWVRSRWPR